MRVFTDIKFTIGSKVLFSVPKDLETVSLSLEQLLGDVQLTLPVLREDQDGYRILSAPYAVGEAGASEIGTEFGVDIGPDIGPDTGSETGPDTGPDTGALTGAVLGEGAAVAPSAELPPMVMGAMQHYPRHYIDMQGDFEEYLNRFSSKTRSTLRRKHRKLVKTLGEKVEFREYRTPEEMDLFRDAALPLSRRTYQSKSLDAALPEDAAAHDLRRSLAAQDRIRAYLLWADGKPISYLYLTIQNNTVVYDFLGYDPDHARLSPGTVLQLEALERLYAEERFRYFDFTEGDGAHKSMFGTHSKMACSYFLLKDAAMNRMLLKSVDAFDASVASAKGIAQKTGALSKIRGALRGS